jgi:CheY-like chemotaxis protein
VNAKQAMPSGGTLTVTASNGSADSETWGEDRRDYVKVIFQDNGPGIPEEVLERIFDPYFTTKPEGTGLGLAVTHSIVAKHQGFIRVESPPGQGACFTVMIPAVPGLVPIEASQGGGKEPGVHSGRILVMDDEDMILEITIRILSKAGYEVEVVKKGEDVLERLNATKDSDSSFSAVIMDLTVPGGLGGRETLPLLREVDGEIPVLVSSGYSSDAVMSDPATHGFDGSVAKPFRAKELLAELSRVLS